MSLRGVSLSRQGKTRSFWCQGKAREKAGQVRHFPPLPSGDGGARVVSGGGFRLRERRLGLGLYFGQAVVREPQPHGVPGQFRVCTAPVAMPLVGMERRKRGRRPRPARVHQNDALMEKSAILVCSGNIEGHIRPETAPWWGWYGMTPSSVVRCQQSGVNFANGAIRALCDV